MKIDKGVENIIISLYTKGMNSSDFEKLIKDLYNFDFSNLSHLKNHQTALAKYLTI